MKKISFCPLNLIYLSLQHIVSTDGFAKPFTLLFANHELFSYVSPSWLRIVRRCSKRRWERTKYMGCIHSQISRFFLLCFNL